VVRIAFRRRLDAYSLPASINGHLPDGQISWRHHAWEEPMSHPALQIFHEASVSESLAALDPARIDREGAGARLFRAGCVAALHVALIGLLLTVQPRLLQDMGVVRMEVRTLREAPESAPPRPEMVRPKPLPQTARARPAPAQPAMPVLTAAPDGPVSASSFQVAPQASAPAPAAILTPAAAPAAPPVPVTAARFDADYLQNPPPAYPAMARRLREEGRVLLLVRVSPQGHAESVQVRQSSGFERLDEAALAAVRQWRFVAARRGDEAIAASVLVPLVFRTE
jgi:protein TonB